MGLEHQNKERGSSKCPKMLHSLSFGLSCGLKQIYNFRNRWLIESKFSLRILNVTTKKSKRYLKYFQYGGFKCQCQIFQESLNLQK